MRINEEHNLGLQVISAIRHAIENPIVKTPHEQWLCDLWNKELRNDWSEIRAENEQISNTLMKGIREKRRRSGLRVER